MQARRFLVPLVATLACAGLLGASCERRVEEPPAEPQKTQPTSTGLGPAERVLAPFVPVGRCVKPTGPSPERTAPPSPDPRCPADPDTPPTLRKGTVVFEGAKGRTVDVEIAEKELDRQRGLMYRKSMPDNVGMIFRFEQKQEHTFWMRNTCIPLDMLFIDDDGLIVGIQENTPTMTDDTFSVGCPSKYVLELNAGWCRKNGVVAGQKVKLEGI
jgi:uncharacterized protein